MVEYDRTPPSEGAQKNALRICIVGVGGAGSNVVDRITLDRIVDATLVCMHTDIRVLGHSMAPVKVQLGADLMKGIGAGGDPDLGREAALFSREQIRQAVDGHDMIFISAGLGGGTGSGAAPVIAEIAKSTGALVIVVATMPFSFEGRRRLGQAEEALEMLQKRVDALVLFENNRMGELILPKDGIQKAFSQADQLIAQSLRAVATITTTPGLVKLGLDDLTTALATANSRCLFGFGEARGQSRGTEALKKALKSPLIDQGRLLSQTRTLLVHVAGGESLTLVEVEGIMKQLGRHVPDHTHILFGLGVDAKLEDSVAITLISSLGLNQLNAHAAAAPPSEMFQPRPVAEPAPTPALKLPPVQPQPAPTPAPAPKREPAPRRTTTAAAPAPAPVPAPAPLVDTHDFLFASEEISHLPTAPAHAPAPAAKGGDLFFTEEVHQPAPVAPTREPVSKYAPPPALVVEDKPEAFILDDEPEFADEEPEVLHVHHQPVPEPAPEPAPAPVRAPVRAAAPAPAPVAEAPVQRPSPAVKDVPASTLASVVARSVTLQTEAAEEPEEDLSFEAPQPVSTIHSTTIVARKPLSMAAPVAATTPASNDSQQTFSLGEEDRGRFKDTEPSIVQGEDLDVPTWMRLKKKLRR